MKLAIVHDELVQWGGAEKLVMAMHQIWPDAPVYTSIYQPKNLPEEFKEIDVRTSFLQKLPFSLQLRRQYFFLYPVAFESFDFSDFDVVISSSTRFAHSVITKPQTLHICYSNSPTRFLWETKKYLQDEGFGGGFLLAPFLAYLRIWDQTAAQRPDFWIANSKFVAEKIAKFYRKDAKVIYPFVDLDKFAVGNLRSPVTSHQSYFLVVSRLLAWKKIEIAIEAANRLKFNLKVVGAGPDLKRLKSKAGTTVEFLGGISDDELVAAYCGCYGLIITQEEDFGITSLEAQAAGKPVVAFKAGGALETVIDGKTGVFFQEQTAESLISGIERLRETEVKPENCFENAVKFSKANFTSQLKNFVEDRWQELQKR